MAYEELPPILSIADAITASSFYIDLAPPAITTKHNITSGVAYEKEEGDVVVEGEMKVGGQEHFYLEPNVTLVVPTDGDELVVYSSTQNPTKTQNFVASTTGLPANRVIPLVPLACLSHYISYSLFTLSYLSVTLSICPSLSLSLLSPTSYISFC